MTYFILYFLYKISDFGARHHYNPFKEIETKNDHITYGMFSGMEDGFRTSNSYKISYEYKSRYDFSENYSQKDV